MKTRPFNLEQALSGAPIVLIGGVKATNFRKTGEVFKDDYPYSADVEGIGTCSFTSTGAHYTTHGASPMDLVMVDDLPDSFLEGILKL